MEEKSPAPQLLLISSRDHFFLQGCCFFLHMLMLVSNVVALIYIVFVEITAIKLDFNDVGGSMIVRDSCALIRFKKIKKIMTKECI